MCEKSQPAIVTYDDLNVKKRKREELPDIGPTAHMVDTIKKVLNCYRYIIEKKQKLEETPDIEEIIELPSAPAKQTGLTTDCVTLTAEQEHVIGAAMTGKSIFFTGAAGTGKSLLLRMLIERLRDKHGADKVYVTAPTGVAAVNINGCTIHSFAGIGLGIAKRSILLNKVERNKLSSTRWKQATVLIIDEVSMLSCSLFETLEYIARNIRKQPLQVFGGVQLVLCGDFFQLPPIVDVDKEDKEDKEHLFCFESPLWKKVIKHSFELSHIFRQHDTDFQRILSEIRVGAPSPETMTALYQCCRPLPIFEDGIKPTRLYPHRIDVRVENEKRLDELPGEIHLFQATDWERNSNSNSNSNSVLLKRLQENCQAPQVLKLKIGAQVLLLKNVDVTKGLVNGSRGVVCAFERDFNAKTTNPAYPVVLFTNGMRRVMEPMTWSCYIGNTEMARRTQVPFVLAWALSIHKSQGMTIDRIEMSLSKVFACGQAYVALSRATTLSGLCLLDKMDSSRIFADDRVIAFYKTLKCVNNE